MIESITEWGTILLGIAVLVATIFHNRNQVKLSSDTMRKELFTEFNKRYSELNEGLAKSIKVTSLEELQSEFHKDEIKESIQDYFDLCAEQYYWKRKKRIDDEIWNSWQAGMKSWYNNSPVMRELWKDQIATYGRESFYLKGTDSFFDEIK